MIFLVFPTNGNETTTTFHHDFMKHFAILCAEACQAGVRDSTSQEHGHEQRGKGQRVSARGEEKTFWALQGRCLYLIFCDASETFIPFINMNLIENPKKKKERIYD